MVRSTTRAAMLVVAASVAAGAALAASPRAAAADPPAPPHSVSVAGRGLAEPLVVRADEQPDRYADLVQQVSWIAGLPGQPGAGRGGNLGPRYTMVLYVRGTPQQAYDVYPLAAGGPRVRRPTAQPNRRRTTEGWFLGPLSMGDALRAAGVPLPAGQGPATVGLGGSGGGRTEPEDLALVPHLDALLDEWRRMLLLDIGVVLFIASGLAGAAYLRHGRRPGGGRGGPARAGGPPPGGHAGGGGGSSVLPRQRRRSPAASPPAHPTASAPAARLG